MLNFMNPGAGQAGPMGGFAAQSGMGGFGAMGGQNPYVSNLNQIMAQQQQMSSMFMMMFNVMTMNFMAKMMQSIGGGGAAVPGGSPGFGGGGGGSNPTSKFLGGGGGGGGGKASGPSGTSGASGASGASSSGTPGPGVAGALDKARSMLGLQEGRDRAKIQEVTGKSGINPATTPWCAAFAMNILKDAGVLDLDGLSNRNYCPTIVSWAKDKGIWGARGSYQPKPGDAIMFDWGGDGTSDHIGIVEKVENGKVITIEGNSSDSVKRNSYDLGSSKIMGYVIGGKKKK